MAALDVKPKSKKRKQAEEDAPAEPPAFSAPVESLEMLSDDEGPEDTASDDGHVDEFPEIDAASDSEEDGSFEDEEDEEEDSDGTDEEDFEEEDSDDSMDRDIFPKPKTIISDITGQPKRVYPEIEPDYDSDSSTEDAPNRVGDVPMHWTSAFDKTAQMDKPLSAEELDIIRRLYANEVPDAGYDPYEPMTEWFTGKGKEEVMPLSAAPEPKRRWVPSKWEKQKVMKIVRAIRQGRILPSKPKTTSKLEFYSIWAEPSTSHAPPLPAPKPRLPTNSESYNPPEEYLPTDAERAEWEALDPEDRERDYLPKKYSSLRLERFSRQLDLYLAPRIQRVKLNIDPSTLIPKLPSPQSLKTFTHSGRARCISISPDGAWVISGDENGVVSLWEVNVGREVKRWKFAGKIGALEWCPRLDVSYFVVGIEEVLHFVIPPNLPSPVLVLTQSLLAPTTLPPAPETPSPVKWVTPPNQLLSSGLPKQIAWHRRGDYMATVSSGGAQGGVWMHQITRRHSQAPFKKIRGAVQLVLFHPLKPHFFVATQQYVRIYNLSEQKLLKTLTPGIKWISSMDVHPSGDHLIVGGYDRKLCWFDLELSDKPYKILRYHTRAIRSLAFHPTYPLFASSSDDGAIQVFHSRVYNDLMTDPLIVPLKILRGHTLNEGLGVLQVKWCARQPWLVSGGADGTVGVWCS
ncbi:NUC169 domain-containing protein [Mycena olivaceomarginata]|nr:NUC169 domain-containing protein [Mycena olivaceomarginata]